MRVFNRSTIRRWQAAYPDAARALEDWFRTVVGSHWKSLDEVRITYPSADQVNRCLIFNIRGNNYRLIARVAYASDDFDGALWLQHFLTHARYDKGEWRKDCT